MIRSTIALTLALGAWACASVPPAPPPPPPTFEQKVSSILRLEDQRVLRDREPPAVAPVAALPTGRRNAPPIVAPPPPDLVRLLSDPEARVRRRAALAIGRVGLAEGIPALEKLLADEDPEVRQMAAFSLGLIGDAAARDRLIAALDDPSLLVKGSAAEALGLLGDASAAPPIGRMVAALVAAGSLAQAPADDSGLTRDTAAAALRLGLTALVRLKSYDAVASAVLDPAGQPRVRWWPVAFALQRLEDPRALPALLTLLTDADPYTRAFAAKGLGAMTDRAAGAALVPLLSGSDKPLVVEAIRSLARLHDAAAGPALLKLAQTAKADPQLRVEAVNALGDISVPGSSDTLMDLLSDPAPPIRAAALRSLARLDAEGFITVLSGLDLDAQWQVRAALATLLGSLAGEAAEPRLRAMLNDPEPRVIPAVLAALAKVNVADAAEILVERLKADDPVIRAAAAQALAELKPPSAAAALAEAYARGERDGTYVARAAALSALAAYGPAAATPLLTEALADPDWAVRVRAVALLKQFDPASEAAIRIRPAPSLGTDRYESPRLVNPSVSTEAYVDTDRGTIKIELAVLDAPQTVENFVSLARKGFYDGLAIHRVVPDFVVQGGDPRGDGEGGPGYVIRDELNQRAFVRGTVGMALDWADTGGSQFFITHSPQPHLDAKYTVFGRVIEGMDVVDQIEAGDVIRRVRIWDGTVAPVP